MKALVVVVMAAAAFTQGLQTQECQPGESVFDGCNTCGCTPRGRYVCTMRACPPSDLGLVYKNEWCEGKGQGGWLDDDCHWCICRHGRPLCTKQLDSCVSGYKTWPQCSGDVAWMDRCNKCICTSDGKAACTKKLCAPE